MNIPELKIQVVREKWVPYTEKPTRISYKLIETLVRDLIGNRDLEHLIALHLNIENKITGYEEISVGGPIDTITIQPREVFKTAILSDAVSIIVAHNHRSGEMMPSRSSIEVAERLKDAGKILGIPVLDHVIISCGGCIRLKATTGNSKGGK